MTPLVTIGIDPGLTNLGLCALVFEPGVKIHEVFDLVRPPKDLREGSRLALLSARAEAFCLPLLAERATSKLKIQAAIEGYDYKGFSTLQMAEITGCLKALLARLAIPLVVVSPSQVKKFAVGDSQADKSKIMARYQMDNEHLADARALAGVAAVYLTGTSELRRELEVIAALRRPKKVKAPRVKKLAGISV